MLNKKWIVTCSLVVGLLSSVAFAGYDSRGASRIQCNSSGFFDDMHHQCMSLCRSTYPEPWTNGYTFSYFKDCYKNCERSTYLRCDAYPRQPTSHASP